MESEQKIHDEDNLLPQELSTVNTNTTIPRKNKFKIFLVITGILLSILIIIILIPLLLSLASKDIPADNSATEKEKTPTVSEKDNAYFDLIKVQKGQMISEEERAAIYFMIESGDWNNYLAERIINTYKDYYDAIDLAATKPKYQDPDQFNEYTTRKYNNISLLSKLAVFKILYEDYQKTNNSSSSPYVNKMEKIGKNNNGFDKSLQLIEINQKIIESKDISSIVFSEDLKVNGLLAVQKLLPNTNLNNNELIYYIKKLDEYNNDENLLYFLMTEENNFPLLFSLFKESIIGKQVNQNSVWYNEIISNYTLTLINGGYYFQENKTRKHLHEQIQEFTDDRSKICSTIQRKITSNLDELYHNKNLLRAYFKENILGVLFENEFKGEMFYRINQHCYTNALISTTQAMIAIKAYMNDTGHYPNSLSVLVPKYLEHIPVDPYDGNEIKYSSTEKNIYSVGSIGKDYESLNNPQTKRAELTVIEVLKDMSKLQEVQGYKE